MAANTPSIYFTVKIKNDVQILKRSGDIELSKLIEDVVPDGFECEECYVYEHKQSTERTKVPLDTPLQVVHDLSGKHIVPILKKLIHDSDDDANDPRPSTPNAFDVLTGISRANDFLPLPR